MRIISTNCVLSMFKLSFIFVKVCGLFEWKRICAGFSLLFVYICIAVGDPNYRFIATVNNISIISWQLDLLVEETGEPREDQRPVASQ